MLTAHLDASSGTSPEHPSEPNRFKSPLNAISTIADNINMTLIYSRHHYKALKVVPYAKQQHISHAVDCTNTMSLSIFGLFKELKSSLIHGLSGVWFCSSRSGSLHSGRAAALAGCGRAAGSPDGTRHRNRRTGSTARCPAAGTDSMRTRTAPRPA